MTNVTDLGTILGIWAHPDDETMVAGGVLATAAKNGQKVACVTFTRGEAGQTSDEKKWPKARLGEIRAAELEEALKIYEIDEHYWFDYHDGLLSQANSEQASAQLADIIRKVKPNTIITFTKDGFTGHADHKAVCKWVCRATAAVDAGIVVYGACESTERYNKLGKKCHELFDIYCGVGKPKTRPETEVDLCYKLPAHILSVKLSAMRAQPSQYQAFFDNRSAAKLIRDFVAEECFIKLN